MSAPDWTPAVGDRVWVGYIDNLVPYEVTQITADEIGTPVVWLCAVTS